MELKFIWVKKHRILDNLEINFNHSGKHSFRLEGRKLKMLANHPTKIDFGTHIKGVSVLAGQNGSGKSSICEILLETTATYANGSMGWNILFDGIVCYDDHIFYHTSIPLENIEELRLNGYTLIAFKDTPFEEMNTQWRNSFAKGGFIYYSNVIDWRSGLDAVNLVNISTQNLMTEDYLYGTYFSNESRFRQLPEYIKYKPTVSQMEAYWYGQGYRFVKFYLEFNEKLNLKAPSVIKLKGSYSQNNKYLHTSGEGVEMQAFDEYERYIFDTVYPPYLNYDKDDILDTDVVILKNAVHNLYKLNILRLICIRDKKNVSADTIQKYLTDSIALSEVFDRVYLVAPLLAIHKELVDNNELATGYKISYLQYRAGDFLSWKFLAIEDLNIENTEDNRDLLAEFISLEEDLLQDDRHILARVSNYVLLPHMSSGEISFYSLFARLYDAIERYEKGIDDRDSIILFIDEAEIGFHPEWKKSFFNTLLTFLKEYDYYDFQLILTTHSPYLLSDVPSENVILLHKNSQGNTEILPNDTFKTFGANIHELLADSFFLTYGFIGDFAKGILNRLFSYLSSQEIINQEFNKEKAKQIISIVAEPILKSQLVQLYDTKFKEKTELEFINEEIERLQNLKRRIQ